MRTRIAGGLLLVALITGLAVAQRPRGPLGRPGRGGGRPGPPRLGNVDRTVPQRSASEDRRAHHGLIENADLEMAARGGRAPRGCDVSGDVEYRYLGNPTKDRTGWGVRFVSGADINNDSQRNAGLTYTVRGLHSDDGRWFRFAIRGLAEPGFSSSTQQLFLRAEFFADDGENSLDSINQNLYGQLEQIRLDNPAGNDGLDASAIWQTYAMEFRTPFPEVDTLRLTVGFSDGDGAGDATGFLIDELDLVRIPDPAEFVARTSGSQSAAATSPAALERMVPLGGRWYYDPRDEQGRAPKRFDHTNADRLYYLTDRLETPFADNMTGWLKRGYLDLRGREVAQDKFVPDNVVVTFTPTHLVLNSHNLPNHPTAVFPDVTRSLDGNPHHIREQDQTFYLPLEPQVNPQHQPMLDYNSRNAMNPGPIGVACNGVVFFDPYDADSVDALWRLDRCCGHPSPMQQYHYHKYPVCVKTPWLDDGTGHSPLIGFALDGFPLYGPYESAGIMAKDDASNPLNQFNLHEDAARGAHYHVTPGQFPHIIGGYWGYVDQRNVRRGPPSRR